MRTIIIGLDAFDPKFFEHLNAQGKLPILGKYVEKGGYARLKVSTPPQSEVSWTSIATGEDPGGHGIFDFVHRNPKTYALEVSLLPTKKTPVGLQFNPPHEAKTFFDAAVDLGYLATSLWWPATFPAKLNSPVRTIPGLGTPDIQGRLGVGSLFTLKPPSEQGIKKTSLRGLEESGDNQNTGNLEGPTRKTLKGVSVSESEFELFIKDNHSGQLRIGKQTTELILGAWSPILEISFKVGFGLSIKAVTRAILTQISPVPTIYFVPLQIHPLHSAWNYGAPKGFVKEMWKNCGPFLTLGWPQDTTGLEEGIIDDAQFLALCEMVFEERKRVFLYLLDQYKEGVLACVFDTLDRVQHMFWLTKPEIVETWYRKLDEFVGQVEERIAIKSSDKQPHLMIISDHGLDDYKYKVHLNRWLIDHGYLFISESEPQGSLKAVRWSKTAAYAIGLNSLYLNQTGREGQGLIGLDKRSEYLKRLVMIYSNGKDRMDSKWLKT
ncbi:MAG: alkaline phosphatase family protein [Chloroflexi bacterium]|nr:alkaline phosphatase family protein [Chloroflexota bacterium]